METRMTIHSPRYCDMGPHQGMMRIDYEGSTYLDEAEMERFYKAGLTFTLEIPDAEKSDKG